MTRRRRWLALQLFWLATCLSRRLRPARGWPPWVAFSVVLPLVRGLCRLACWVGPRGREHDV